MQKIIIQPGVLEIMFMHEQQPNKPTFIQIPATELERIINDYVSSKSRGVTVVIEDGKRIYNYQGDVSNIPFATMEEIFK